MHMQLQVPAPVPPADREAPLLSLARLNPYLYVPLAKMCSCPLPEGSKEDLLRAFQAAPQFRRMDAPEILKRGGSRLRVILLAEDACSARQAARYLAALCLCLKEDSQDTSEEDEDDEENRDLDDLGDLLGDQKEKEEEEEEENIGKSMRVLHPSLLDPGMEEKPSGKGTPGEERKNPGMNIRTLTDIGLLLTADHGPVLTEGVMEKLAVFCTGPQYAPIFLALRPAQVDLRMMEELRFQYGFLICQVERPDPEYQKRQFLAAADALGVSLAADVNVDAVLDNLRRYRGESWDEADMEVLLQYALGQGATSPLRQEDLMIRPLQTSPDCGGWKKLQSMVGLGEVKETLRRKLAVMTLERRHAKPGVISYRNMAFTGSPGTGKSVTARLVAQILREEGCGSGRFVEAGREQLIGTYLGHTSPQIADLFQKARGGVLFIDEAGALLENDNDSDSYATEAVNAIVRHMELSPETMVIFATYPDEMRKLLASNPGLSSRVSNVVEFPDYTPEDLWDILEYLARDRGQTIPADSRPDGLRFFRELKTRKGKGFGNGREARRLLETAIEEMALRALEDPEVNAISVEDLRLAEERLLRQEKESTTSRPIGFVA